MAKMNCAWAAFLLFAVCKAQFFYNDDDNQQSAYQDPPAASLPAPPPRDNTYDYDRTPATVRHNPSQQRSHSENFREQGNYQPAPRAPPAPAPVYEHRPEPSRPRRRGNERRYRAPPPPPRVYSPSVFENLAVGKPPAGVHVPEDSFLNVLTNGGRAPRARQSPAYEPPPPQQTPYAQPPPAQTPPQQTPYAQLPPAQPPSRPTYVQNPPQSRPYSRAPAPPPRVQRTQAAPSPIHNPPHIEGAQPEPVESPVQHQAPPAPVQPVPQRSSRRRSGVRPIQTTVARPSWNSNDEEYQRPRRVFGPSVFENLAPGIAPPGIHVPEDSFLNILRNDRHNIRTRRDHVYGPAPPPTRVEEYEPAPLPPAPGTQYEPAPPAPIVAQHAPSQYSTESRPSTQEFSADYEIPQEIQAVQPVPRNSNRQHRRPSRQPEFVDNAGNHQTNEDQPRMVQQRKPVQSRRRTTVRKHRHFSGSVPDADENEEEIFEPPKKFAPSVFEKFGLGEAPPGVYVPKDSFLNLLRGDSPVSHSSQSPGNQRSRPATPPEAATITEDVYDRQNRQSRVPHANQSPPHRSQSLPIQEYQPVNVQSSPRDIRKPTAQQPPQPAVVPQAVPPAKRQRQRSQNQPVSAPRQQPVYEDPDVIYNARSEFLEDDDIPRYRSQDNNQRIRQQEQVPQRKRVNTAPRHVPPPPPQPAYKAPPQPAYKAPPQPAYEAPPQPAYEAPPQPEYEAPQLYHDDSFQEEDIPRRRPPSRNRRPTQVQQPAQRPRESSQSRRPPPQPQPIRNVEVSDTRQQDRFRPAKLSVKPLPDDVDGDQIPGEAGIDYPTFHVIPRTSFSCAQQAHNGYYADLETSCQVVHMCQAGGVQSSFLCPNGTIFNQEKFSCQWWYKVNCADAPSHYEINDKLYKVPPPPPPARRNRN